MHRDDWKSVFQNQERILKQLKPLEDEMFLAGGTGLQRFVLQKPYRHSEDLDFFFPILKTNKELQTVFEKNYILDFNFQSKILKKAQEYELELDDYIEIVEENNFIVNEWRKRQGKL